jgi:hypothetical protein
MVADCGDELDALPRWQSVGHEPAPGHQFGTRRRHETVRRLARRRNKERVMRSPSNPCGSEPACRLDLIGWFLPLAVDDGDRHPPTELGLRADQAPHAERHAYPPKVGLVHSRARLRFHPPTSIERPNARETGFMSQSSVRKSVIPGSNLNTSPIYQTRLSCPFRRANRANSGSPLGTRLADCHWYRKSSNDPHL